MGKRDCNLNFRIESEEYEKLEKIANELGNSISGIMRIVLKRKIKEVEKDGWNPYNFIK